MADALSKVFAGTTVSLCRGDITRQQVEAVVNAAKSSLLGGGGVDGAIHRAGGSSIKEECLEIRKLQGGCPTGSAVITGGGNLKAQYVIHTVGPIWRGRPGGNEAELLASAYRNSLQLALQYNLRTLAFPSISTGAYGYPVDEAAVVAISTVASLIKEKASELEREGKSPTAPFDEVRFVLFDPKTLDAYRAALEATN